MVKYNISLPYGRCFSLSCYNYTETSTALDTDKIRMGIMIKKIFYSLLLTTFAVLGFASFANAENSSEIIDNYNVSIVIDSDATIQVTETILYNFGPNSKHGIIRNIPYKYKARGGNYKLEIDEIDVVDENGASYTFETSNSSGEKSIKIGDADKYVTGVMTYVIRYKVDKAFNYFDNFDELYWNAIGTEWNVPIMQGDINVVLPDTFNQNDLMESCYFGDAGSNEECTGEFVLNSDELTTKKATFNNFYLNEYQGVTVVLGLPKSAVYEPTFWERTLDTFLSNSILLLPIFVFFLMYYLWKKYGKDPILHSIVARYTAPMGLSPAESGMIYDEKSDNREISATLIKLAIDGHIKINQIKKKGTFSRDDYELVKLNSSDKIANKIEKDLMEKVFSGKEKIKISDLKDKFYTDLINLKSTIYKDSVSDGYFKNNPNSTRNTYFIIGVGVAIVGTMLSYFGFLTIFSFIISGIIIIVFSFIMPARTKKGAETLEHLKGLKLYIEVAESERIKFHNSPKKTPKLFEELLPYAMIFGLEKEWAKEFEDIYKEPRWYSGQYDHGFSAYYMASSLGSFNQSATSNMSSAPSSASGGGSGFSGGGSGGGFGGGGGGSW